MRLVQKGKLEGIGNYSAEIFGRMATQHPEHEFFFIFDRPFDQSFICADNIKALVLGPPTRHVLLIWFWMQFRLPVLLRKIKADIFISPDGWMPDYQNCSTVQVIHDLNFEHYPQYLPKVVAFFYRKLFPTYAAKASKIITVSEFSRQDIIKCYQVKANKIAVVGNGVKEVFKPLKKDQILDIQKKYAQGQAYFIYVGSLHKRKNIGNLLLAFDIYKKQSGSAHKLLLAGEAMWLDSEMQNILQQLNYKDEVIFAGRLPDAELSRALAAASALLFVPYFEGFGVPVLEAMRCKVPVLCSNTSSLPEVAGNFAILVNPNSPTEIAEKIKSVLHLNESHLESAYHHSLQYSWPQLSESFYQEIKTLP